MDRQELAGRIDHTVLGPETTPKDVDRVVRETVDHGMNVCIPPCYVATTAEQAPPTLTIATVIGFPHGQDSPEIKREAGASAWKSGADELDVVINIGRLKAGDTEAVTDEIAEIVAAVPIPVKVIIETALLTDAEKRRACQAAVAADAAMVKTSTGFVDAEPAGATVADVELMAAYLPVKASGGIGDYETAMAMIEAGADRIGASSGVDVLAGAPE
ncbi:deoxyribose-phosphate aldolase [Halohasta litchfieldiae]|jgi:deoxyribose-phosphate aldolase|uniref:Deoxyribose-phosphate aldolase n=1 Tax=Halohasta litchfieldiae TaxID=1073996 RepID=A0A1H6RWA8_9EURY|nr:deoxyribose-phosphate aldolase [Halohasta litchfieldiae]ATW89234.1 deoxyribose-phosphate aldolase [Halohasta litchfieldiae]SEI57764.1 deoxyribose-phosphate aldolase [Halohasta litchfieldiae]